MIKVDENRPSSCVISKEMGHCVAYRPGHQMHVIQAGLIGGSPWGWRDGVVSATDSDGWIKVDFLNDPGGVTAWHHHDPSALLSAGTPVRVHEEFHALGVSSGWICLFITSGIGPVPKPQDANVWRTQMTGGVIDVTTGIGLALDHVTPRDATG